MYLLDKCIYRSNKYTAGNATATKNQLRHSLSTVSPTFFKYIAVANGALARAQLEPARYLLTSVTVAYKLTEVMARIGKVRPAAIQLAAIDNNAIFSLFSGGRSPG